MLFKLKLDKLEGSKLHVVDVSAVARSRYYYFDKFSWEVNGEEVKTGAIYSVMSLFKTIPLEERVVFCFDFGGSIRKKENKDYKSNRVSIEDSYYAQMNVLKDILEKCGFDVLGENGYEADDFVSYVVGKYKDSYDHVIIHSHDLDLTELIDTNVYIKNVMSKRDDITLDNYEDVMGIPYNTTLLKKAIVGCSSDNIKGVPGIGDKKFLKLLEGVKEEYNLADIRKENLEEEIIRKYIEYDKIGLALTSLNLAKTRLPSGYRLNEIYSGVNRDLLIWFLNRYGMKSIVKHL